MRKIIASVIAGAFPMLALAQVQTTYSGGSGIGGLLRWFSGILNLLVPLIISIAVVWFIWGVFRYAIAANEEDKAKAKTNIIYGIVALFIMVSVWGLVGIISSTFQLSNQAASGPSIPVLQGN